MYCLTKTHCLFIGWGFDFENELLMATLRRQMHPMQNQCTACQYPTDISGTEGMVCGGESAFEQIPCFNVIEIMS